MPTPSAARRTAAAVAVGCILVTSACAGGDTAPPPCVVASVAVSPTTATLAVGSTTQLAALAATSNCSATPAATWSSNNQTVATVSSSGLVTGVAAGNAVISAAAGGQSGSAAITVAPPLTVVSVTPSNAATFVRIDPSVRVVFSAAVDPATVTPATVTVALGGTVVPGALSVVGNSVTFRPAAPLTEFISTYTVTATQGVKSVAGIPLASTATSTFSTVFADPGYLYRLSNEAIGPTKALDTYNGPLHRVLVAPVLDVTGQFWYFDLSLNDAPCACYLLKNNFLGDGQALEGADPGGQSLMTPIAANNAPAFSGQVWTFTAVGAPFANGYKVKNLAVPTMSLDPYLADGSFVGLRTTSNATSQVWYVKRVATR